MLKEFHALPTENRVREMKDRDYLWCVVQMLLDREEELEQLCPACRMEAEQARCPGCGTPMAEDEGWQNPAFDMGKFEEMRGGGRE